MTPPRFQFTIRGLLWATFLVLAALIFVGMVLLASGTISFLRSD